MIGYLVLMALQAMAAWFGGPYIWKYIPIGGDPQIFVKATVFGLIVWVTGLVGSFALKDVRLPSTNTLAWAIMLALICAGLVLVPQVMSALPLKGFDKLLLPLAGAILGYMIRR